MKKMTLQNKIDFAVVFTAINANPNGDPLGGNRPRTTSDGRGEVSDVCLKRKIRNRLQEAGNEIFVQSDDKNMDGEESLLGRYKKFKSTFESKLPKNKLESKSIIAEKACEKWIDVRSFGQVFAFGDGKKGNGEENGGEEGKSVSIGIRGPVTIQSAFSIESVTVESIQITKSVNGEPTTKGEKSSDTMGMKHRILNAVYVAYGSISPQLAEKTGFSDEDAKKIKEALRTLFEGDESSARPSGSMIMKKVIWVKHNNKAGQYSSARVHNSIEVDNEGNVTISPLEGLVPEIIEGYY